MRPCLANPLKVLNVDFGGPKPLFCVPLTATNPEQLLRQAVVARDLRADLVEWRADCFANRTEAALTQAASRLRSVVTHAPILFTLRGATEGGKSELAQNTRKSCIERVAESGSVNLIDIELSNEESFVQGVIQTAHRNAAKVVLSFHDFLKTPDNGFLLDTIGRMVERGGDIAKLACMPQNLHDVLRMLEVTLTARERYPATPLCTMAMGGLGSVTRTAGFLYGSDMAFAVGEESSAPGQIPIADARAITAKLLQYS
jgi:3-dehydroquinate dehydratase I